MVKTFQWLVLSDGKRSNGLRLGAGRKQLVIHERSEEKTQQSAKVTISRKKLKQYFPENYTKAEMENIIYQLLEKWKSDGYDI